MRWKPLACFALAATWLPAVFAAILYRHELPLILWVTLWLAVLLPPAEQRR